MAGDSTADQNNPREDDPPPSGQVESDDTTQADAGMTGGTGAEEGEATVNPLGTERDDDEVSSD